MLSTPGVIGRYPATFDEERTTFGGHDRRENREDVIEKPIFLGTNLTEREYFLLCKRPSLTDFCSEAGSRRLERDRLRHPLSPGSPSPCPQLQDPGRRPGLRSVAHVHLGLCPAGCSPPSGHVISHITAKHPHRRETGQNGSLLL